MYALLSIFMFAKSTFPFAVTRSIRRSGGGLSLLEYYESVVLVLKNQHEARDHESICNQHRTFSNSGMKRFVKSAYIITKIRRADQHWQNPGLDEQQR
jgi:hypothetical protein